MIPQNDGLTPDIKITERPTLTYKMDLSGDVIERYTDNLKAMEQAIYKIIRTERYRYIIYSWDYGIELEDLFGMPVSYCIPEIERRIKEALLQDTRILEVNNFEFETPKKGVVFTKFRAVTIFGNVNVEREVQIS
ncbi:MAG: DUF2634 domain-containing protein [Bacteroidota bacterium]|nr:DUF2634 domain-containing protein [Bacteroidota bacterium]